MKAQDTAVYGALALAGLSLAYLTWQRPKETLKSDSVVILETSKQSLEKLHFEDGKGFVDLVRRTEGEPRWWVTLGSLPPKPAAADAGADAGAVSDGGTDGGIPGGVDAGLFSSFKLPEPVKEPNPTRTVKAGERADAVVARFSPFIGLRALGVLPEAKLAELGLKDSERKLDVTVAGARRSFVASKPMPGLIGSYLQDATSREVYLLASTMFSELDPSSSSLVDRRLHTFKVTEFDAFTLKQEKMTAEFVQTNAQMPATAKVARKASPDKPDDTAKNWHDQVFNRLVVTEVLGEGERPKTGEPTVKLRIEYTERDKARGWLELAKDSDGSLWARSENTASWVSVHAASDQLLEEATKLIAPQPQ